MVSYLCMALKASLNAFSLPQYNNFTHGLPFQSSSSVDTAARKLEELEAHVCHLHHNFLGSRDTVYCGMAWVHRKVKKISLVRHCFLWSRHNLLGMAEFFSFQSEGILISLGNDNKDTNEPVCELSRNQLP